MKVVFEAQVVTARDKECWGCKCGRDIIPAIYGEELLVCDGCCRMMWDGASGNDHSIKIWQDLWLIEQIGFRCWSPCNNDGAFVTTGDVLSHSFKSLHRIITSNMEEGAAGVGHNTSQLVRCWRKTPFLSWTYRLSSWASWLFHPRIGQTLAMDGVSPPRNGFFKTNVDRCCRAKKEEVLGT